jgi:hypothetical protein
MVGLAKRGPIGQPQLYTSWDEWRNVHGPADSNTLETYAAVQSYFEEGGQFLWFVRTAHYSDISSAATLTAAKGTITVDNVGNTAALLEGDNAGPYALDHGDSISIDVNEAGAATATIQGTKAALTAGTAGTYDLTDGGTLTLQIDDGSVQTITFATAQFADIDAATVDEVAAVVNAQLDGGFADDNGGSLRITSDKKGTDSRVEVTGGTDSAAFNFGAAVDGTGNVADVTAVSVAELTTIMEAAISGIDVFVPAADGVPDIQTTTLGDDTSLEITASTNIQTAVGWDAGPESGSSGAGIPTLILRGKYPGAYANSIKAKVLDATNGEADHFNLQVLENDFLVESFQNLNMDDDSDAYVETVLAAAGIGSFLIEAVDQDAGGDQRPANGDYTLISGDDGLVGLADSDFIGSSASDTGLRAFDLISDITLLACPSRATAAMHNAMITYAETTRNGTLFCVLDPPAAQTASGIIAYVETTAGLLGTTEYGATYWPRVKILNPNKAVFGKSDTVTVPPSGAICGLYARIDASRPGGVYVNPAGIENGLLRSIVGLEDDPGGLVKHQVNKEQVRDLVYPKRINMIDSADGVLKVRGSRTLRGDSNFPNVAERRGVIFIERSVKAGIKFAEEQNHTERLREAVHRAIEAFLQAQMRNGAFRSEDPATAFFVDVGKGLNPPSVVFANQLIARIGVATNKPAEFIILRFTQDTRAFEQELARS